MCNVEQQASKQQASRTASSKQQANRRLSASHGACGQKPRKAPDQGEDLRIRLLHTDERGEAAQSCSCWVMLGTRRRAAMTPLWHRTYMQMLQMLQERRMGAEEAECMLSTRLGLYVRCQPEPTQAR